MHTVLQYISPQLQWVSTDHIMSVTTDCFFWFPNCLSVGLWGDLSSNNKIREDMIWAMVESISFPWWAGQRGRSRKSFCHFAFTLLLLFCQLNCKVWLSFILQNFWWRHCWQPFWLFLMISRVLFYIMAWSQRHTFLGWTHNVGIYTLLVWLCQLCCLGIYFQLCCLKNTIKKKYQWLAALEA